MFATEALAQGASTGAGSGLASLILPIAALFAIMYFLMIRPQQKRMRTHQAMVQGLKRGDKIVTAGGLVVKVVRAVEGEEDIEVELSQGVVVKVMRQTVAEVRQSASGGRSGESGQIGSGAKKTVARGKRGTSTSSGSKTGGEGSSGGGRGAKRPVRKPRASAKGSSAAKGEGSDSAGQPGPGS